VPAFLRTKHTWLFAAFLLVSCQTTDDQSAVGRDLVLPPDGTTVQALVPQNATIESLLRQQQVPADMTSSLVEAIAGVFNPRDLRANQTYWVTRTIDGIFREFRYQVDADRLLRVVFKNDPGQPVAQYAAELVILPKEYRLSAVSALISSEATSLSAAFEAEGENFQLPRVLAEIFGGEVDFNSDMQRGDKIDVLFDRATRDGAFVGYGDVQAALIDTDGRKLSAFRFLDADGQPAWFDAEGRSLRRQFLRTPLPFDPRVTSGFSTNRFHPVNGVRRPHLGVDFGAPTGTRVKAVASGVVQTAGWQGEAGRMVRIRHAGGYETAYLHLSGFAPGIRAGARVEQGAEIGYVGSTGSATGPHLDYRVVKNGVYLNPLTAFRNMPSGEPVPAAHLPEFTRVRDEALHQLQARLAEKASGTVQGAAVSD
jgi:murein DD-endopeptidase MepM/ murein hydrolase activator NlpD